jgi:hypothetical protein
MEWFWVTARAFQVDHYSTRPMGTNLWVGGMEYSLFGENLPFFSRPMRAWGYTGQSFETSLLAGKEYLWVLGERCWIPLTRNPAW